MAEVLALVGMRSGSVGLPDKNVLPLAGHPLCAWILSAARRSERVTRLVVSTDSAEYAAIARRYGAETPVLRPVELATADATDVLYVAHMLDHLERTEGYRPDVVLRLLTTVPLQAPEDLDAVVDTLLADPDADSAMVVAEARQHPMKAMRHETDPDGRVRLVPYLGTADRVEPAARQAYAPAYLRANVVATRPETVRRTGTLAGEQVASVVIDAGRAVDIDTAADLRLAEVLLELADPPVPPPIPLPDLENGTEGARP